MRIDSIMSKRVITVDIDDSLLEVKDIFDHHKIQQVLVVENFKLVGIVSDRDYLKISSPNVGTAIESAQDRRFLQKRVHQVMTRHPVTITPEHKVTDVIHIINDKKISSLPVLNPDGRPVGIVSWIDIFKLFDSDKKDLLTSSPVETATDAKPETASNLAQTAVQIQKLPHSKGIDLPFYATEHAAGADLRAAIDKDITMLPGEHKLIRTGFAMALADGFEAQIRPRSGLAYKYGITVLNSPGTIDADYRGEIGVILVNHGKKAFTITRGERIAQMIIAPFVQASFKEVSSLSETVRGEGGFGSSGRK